MNDFPRSPDPDRDPDRDAEALRRLLAEAVSDVEPRDGLGRIHARTKVTPMSRRPWFLGAAAAVVATAATVFAVTVLASGDSRNEPPPVAGSPTAEASQQETPAKPSSSATADPSQEGDPSPSTTPTPTPSPGTSQVTVPVYYTGDTSRGPRLFREFHSAEAAGGDQLTAAVNEAVSAPPMDPDYRTSWPAMTRASAQLDGDLITVDLGGDPEGSLSERPAGMSSEEARAAVQQLVYTAQGAVQERAPVRFLLFGEPAETVLGVPVEQPVREQPSAEVLAQVWILEPVEGARVSSPFEVSGLANAFEANVQWELMDGDRVVKRGFTTAQECCRMAPFSFRVEAPAGEYTLVVHDTDPSGGEGFAPWQDTKRIVVTR